MSLDFFFLTLSEVPLVSALPPPVLFVHACGSEQKITTVALKEKKKKAIVVRIINAIPERFSDFI